MAGRTRFERGDNLYADAAWLFAADRQTIIVHAPELEEDGGDAFVYSGHTVHATTRSPFELAMEHLGIAASLQYFPPAEDSRFDWTPFRDLPDD